jgi:alpha/beta superfamily hydrolase
MSDLPEAPETFPTEPLRFLLDGPAGKLEAAAAPALALEAPAVAVVCQPHPLHGGTMDNKVVTTVERALRELGIPTVRFNFRGAGASQGVHDHGVGEQDDLAAIVEWARRTKPGAALWLAGFSFGSYVSAAAARRLLAAQLVSIAPPVGRWDFAKLTLPYCPWLVVMGDADEVVDPATVYAYLAALAEPPQVIRMPATSHFFHGKLTDLRTLLGDALRDRVPRA